MKLNNISFPYPVLGVNDDIQPGLKDDALAIAVDRSNPIDYILSISIKYENPYIAKLVEQGYAQYICEYDCIKTNLKKSISCNVPDFTFNINRRFVSGNVDLSCYITVIKPIVNYINPGFHEDYSGVSFNLSPGDILAGFPIFSFVADQKFDKLKSATSFMQIRHDLDNEYTNFEFTPTTIDIKLPTRLFNLYNSGVGMSFAEVIHSSIAHSALLSALYEINDHLSSQWAQAIIHLIKNNGDLKDYYEISENQITLMDIPHIATMLLKDPYDRMLTKLDSINSSPSIFENE